MSTDAYIVQILRPDDDEEKETDTLTSLSLSLWDFLLSLFSLGKTTYDRLRLPVGLYLFGRPLPSYESIQTLVTKGLERGKFPPFGSVFLGKVYDQIVSEEGENVMKLSWRKIEEKFGKKVALQRRPGSGNITHSLDLYNLYWEVEYKRRNSLPVKFNPSYVYEIVSRGMMRGKCPAIVVEIQSQPPRYILVLFNDIINNKKVYGILGVDLSTVHPPTYKSLSFNVKDGVLVCGKTPLPVIGKLMGTLPFVAVETNVQTLREVFQINPLTEK